MRFLILGRSLALKKKTKKKITKRTTLKIHNILLKHVPVFLYSVTMLIFQIKRIISGEKWVNRVVTFFLFFYFFIFLLTTLRPSSLSSPFSPTDPFSKKKKWKNVVKPFFTWNNSFNLTNEHGKSIEKNRDKDRNIFFTVYCAFCQLIKIREC